MRGVAGVLAAMALLGGAAGCSDDGDRSNGADPTPDAAAGSRIDDAELQERWWAWAYQEHSAPVEDQTGEFCALGQPDDVWFLAGTFGGRVARTCEIPAGRPLAFPVVNITTTVPEDCDDFMGAASGSATLDGRLLEVEAIGATEVTLDTDHGEGDYVACGLWTRAAGLEAGRHTLEIRGSAGTFRTRVDYTLVVR